MISTRGKGEPHPSREPPGPGPYDTRRRYLMSRQSADMPPLSQLHVVEERLRSRGEVWVNSLSEELGVSEVTIRRHLSALAESGLAKRVRGGAVLVESSFSDPSFVDRKLSQRDAKRRVAQRCAELLPQSASLFVGGGTTTSVLVQFLRDRAGLQIFTSNLAAAAKAKAGGCTIAVIGGTVRGPTCALVGGLARASLSLLWADKAVLGADAISGSGGITSHSPDEADVARMMVEHTRGDVICIVDGTKWNANADHVVVASERLSTVVTDYIPGRERRHLEHLGVKVEVV